MRNGGLQRRDRRVCMRHYRTRTGGHPLERGTRRTGQLALPDGYPPGSPLCAAGRTHAGDDRYLGTETIGRCRSGGIPQCRKVYAAFYGVGGPSEDCQLSVHYAGTESGYRLLPRREVLRDGRHPGYHRRGQRREGAGPALPAPHRT